MDEDRVTRREFDMRCKAVNGDINDIKMMVIDIQQKVDRNLANVQQMFAEYAQNTITKTQTVYITTVTALFVGTFSVLITLLASHMIR